MRANRCDLRLDARLAIRGKRIVYTEPRFSLTLGGLSPKGPGRISGRGYNSAGGFRRTAFPFRQPTACFLVNVDGHDVVAVVETRYPIHDNSRIVTGQPIAAPPDSYFATQMLQLRATRRAESRG